jgi:hypothetical protein
MFHKIMNILRNKLCNLIQHQKHINFQIVAKAFHTENTTAELQINNILKGEDGIICLSLFIKMCESCKLKLTLTDGRGNSLKEIFYASRVNNKIKLN